MAKSETPPEATVEKVIPVVGGEAGNARRTRRIVLAVGALVGAAAIVGIVYGLSVAVRHGVSGSVTSLNGKHSAKNQGVAPATLQRDLAHEAGTAGRGSPEPGVTPRGNGGTAQSGSEGNGCKAGEHAEPRFKEDGTAYDECVEGVSSSKAGEGKQRNRYDEPLQVEGSGQLNAERNAASGSATGDHQATNAQDRLANLLERRQDAMDKSLAAQQANATPGSDGEQRAGVREGPAEKGVYPPDPGLADRLKASVLSGVPAGRLGNMSLMWSKGTGVDCVLDGRIDTSLGGYVTCTLADNVYSANGKTLLVEKGSMGFVEYHTVERVGQNRFDAMVSSIRTANGVTFNLESGAMGPLGEAGATGYLDNQWMARIGGALLVAVIGDIATYEQDKSLASSSGATGVVSSNGQTGSTAKGLPDQILGYTMQIKPRIIKAQGESVRIVAARDVDFSPVYDLRPTYVPSSARSLGGG